MSAKPLPLYTPADAPPVPVPPGYRGWLMLPGTGRLVYWTGRICIGLRHDVRSQRCDLPSRDALTLQSLVLGDSLHFGSST
jgi:hypothetical protein